MTVSLIKGRRKYVVGLIIVLLLAVGAARIFHFWPFHKQAIVATGSSFITKGEPSSQKAAGSSSASKNSGSSGSSNSATTPSASAVLYTPTGDFVSNHHPNLSGSPAPNTMSSVCNTTPGANCQITFTQGGTTKKLASEKTDVNGSAYWNWKLQDIGLTAGSWKVQAVASLNSQTKTADDAMDLVVSQ